MRFFCYVLFASRFAAIFGKIGVFSFLIESYLLNYGLFFVSGFSDLEKVLSLFVFSGVFSDPARDEPTGEAVNRFDTRHEYSRGRPSLTGLGLYSARVEP